MGPTVVRTESQLARFNTARALFETLRRPAATAHRFRSQPGQFSRCVAAHAETVQVHVQSTGKPPFVEETYLRRPNFRVDVESDADYDSELLMTSEEADSSPSSM